MRQAKHSRRAVLTGLLMLVILLVSVTVAQAATGTITADGVRVRAGAGTTYQVMGSLDQGAQVTVLEQRSGWARISTGKLNGWVSGDYLQVKEEARIRVTGTLVNLRSTPTTNAQNIIGQVKKGDLLTLAEQQGEWYKVRLPSGTFAYITTSLAEKAGTATPAPSSPAPGTKPAGGEKTVKSISGQINVRSGPATTYPKTGVIDAGISCPLLGQEAEWLRIKLPDGSSGYVAGWLVTVMGGPASSSPPAGDKTPTVILDGKAMNFEVPPIIEDGRTLVPLRAIFEAFGASVDWEQRTQTVTATKDQTKVVLKIGSRSPTVNGQTWPLDVPAKIVNNRTLAPLRFVGEAFGGKVDWDQQTRTVTMQSPVQPPSKKVASIIVQRGPVSLWSGPSTDYNKVGSAEQGEKLPVVDSQGDWYQVNRGGTLAWVAGWLVETSDEVVPVTPGQDPVEPPKPPKPAGPTKDTIQIAKTVDNTGIKITVASGAALKADIKESRNQVIYEFEDRQLEGLNLIKVDLGSGELKVKARNEGKNAIVEVTFPYGTEYRTASEEGGKKEVFILPNRILKVDRKTFGKNGERVVVTTLVPTEYEQKLSGDRLEVTFKDCLPGEADDKYTWNSQIIEQLTVNQAGRNVTFTFKTRDLHKHVVGADTSGTGINIMMVDSSGVKPASGIVVLDPGHGGSEPGTIGSQLKEKDANLAIALKAGAILEQKGIKVAYTRTDDSDVGLEERAAFANRLNADLFVSIHNNAALNNPVASGTETFFYAPADSPELFIQRDERQRLARCLQSQLTAKLGRIDRGAKEKNLSVLRNTQMTSALVECVFVSNPEEESLLLTEAFKNKAAEAIAAGIEDYLRK